MSPDEQAGSVSIRMYPDGPLLVRGDVALIDESGNPIESERPVLSLCRCGKSNNAPLCDGSHARRRRRTKD
jgi:CDGSH-type Zn-finger protein